MMNHHKTKRARLSTSNINEVTIDDFTLLQSPHPYGVLPLGNRFFSNRLPDSNVSDTSDGNCKNPIDLLSSEECWNTVLSFLDGVSLAKSVAATCRFLYVASHQPELWRDLVLIHCQRFGGTSSNSNDTAVIDQVGSTWKDTFAILYTSKMTNDTKSKTKTMRHFQHSPMTMKGSIYSDYYYRLHSCRSFSIPEAWLVRDDSKHKRGNSVVTVPIEHMTTDRFIDDFERRNVPVNIQGACLSWDAYKKWQDVSYLERHTMHQTFRSTSGVAPYPAQFTFPAYRNYCVGWNNKSSNNEIDKNVLSSVEESHLLEEGPLYLFDRTALRPNSVLWKDYMYDLQRTCPFWDPNKTPQESSKLGGHDLFGLLGEGRRPDHTWLICGPKRSGSVFHIDPNGTHAWNATICGRKRWIFYPPGVSPPGVYPSDDGDEVALPLTIGEWILQYWEEHCDRKRKDPVERRPMECTTMPGDVVFVPHGWWHFVVNLDEWNVAITHNYVSASNLSNCLRFLNEKRDQVSGCRDRNESIKPEQLFEEFVDALQIHHPIWLNQALSEPDWTCDAWRKNGNTTRKLKRELKEIETDVVSILEKKDSTSLISKAKIEGTFLFSFEA